MLATETFEHRNMNRGGTWEHEFIGPPPTALNASYFDAFKTPLWNGGSKGHHVEQGLCRSWECGRYQGALIVKAIDSSSIVRYKVA